MEGAFTSGLMAANALCELEQVRPEPLWSVPLHGMMRDNG